MAATADKILRHPLLTISKLFLAAALLLSTAACFDQSPTPTRRATLTPAVTPTEYPTPTYPTPEPLPTDPTPTLNPTPKPYAGPPGSIEKTIDFFHQCLRDNSNFSELLISARAQGEETHEEATAFVAAMAHSRDFTHFAYSIASTEHPELLTAYSATGTTYTEPCPKTKPPPTHADITKTPLYSAISCWLRDQEFGNNTGTDEIGKLFPTDDKQILATLLAIYFEIEAQDQDIQQFLEELPPHCRNQIKHGPFTFPLAET